MSLEAIAVGNYVLWLHDGVDGTGSTEFRTVSRRILLVWTCWLPLAVLARGTEEDSLRSTRLLPRRSSSIVSVMDPSGYLERIGHRLDVPRSPESLASLMDHHLRRVPFENLDIHLGVPISLELANLYDKIVVRRRGGFCYELNGLFAWLLREMGFEVDMLAARVIGSDGGLGIEYDHMVLLVRLEDDWLVDVGFGDGHRTPLALRIDVAQHDPAGQFRIAESEQGLRLDRKENDGEWAGQFVFTAEPQALEVYVPACRWQQTSPDSHFTQQRVATIALSDNGRLTYSGMRRIETTSSGRSETELESEEAWWAGVAAELGISVDR